MPTRVVESIVQRYFRTGYEYGDAPYPSAVCIPPSNQRETPEADPALHRWTDATIGKRFESPRFHEVVMGWSGTEDTLVGMTHRGTVLRLVDGLWSVAGALSTVDLIPGCYWNLTWMGD